jgi:hypothetical protein
MRARSNRGRVDHHLQALEQRLRAATSSGPDFGRQGQLQEVSRRSWTARPNPAHLGGPRSGSNR